MSKRVSKEPKVIIRDGKPVSVILPIKEYGELIKRLGDADHCVFEEAAEQTTVFPSAVRIPCRTQQGRC